MRAINKQLKKEKNELQSKSKQVKQQNVKKDYELVEHEDDSDNESESNSDGELKEEEEELEEENKIEYGMSAEDENKYFDSVLSYQKTSSNGEIQTPYIPAAHADLGN